MFVSCSPCLPVVRVYTREFEAKSFPEIAAAYGVETTGATSAGCATVFTDDGQSCLVEPPLHIQALHHKIRSHSNPLRDRIEQCAQRINQLREHGEDRNQVCKVLKDYRQAVKKAEQYELSAHTGPLIIFTTCLEVGSSRVRNHSNVRQCVIDDSNMCLEAEILVVLQAVSATCNQVVLIGDRESLCPIIQNKTTRRFGLTKSLFQSLLNVREKNALPYCTLGTNYRMVSALYFG